LERRYSFVADPITHLYPGAVSFNGKKFTKKDTIRNANGLITGSNYRCAKYRGSVAAGRSATACKATVKVMGDNITWKHEHSCVSGVNIIAAAVGVVSCEQEMRLEAELKGLELVSCSSLF
jgi:hypothetical protein